MAMNKFGAYTDDAGVVVSVGDGRKKKDDGVTTQAIKVAEDRLAKSGNKNGQTVRSVTGEKRQ